MKAFIAEFITGNIIMIASLMPILDADYRDGVVILAIGLALATDSLYRLTRAS